MVVSASRSRDLVHRCPAHLADMLAGRADVRLGRHGPAGRLDLADVGALVLWTKQPAPLVECEPLRDVLARYVEAGGIVVLQLSVTGFGGSPVEPGIPHPLEVAASLGAVLARGIVEPRAVKLRYDPVGTIRFPGGRVHSNLDLELFVRVLELFVPLGVGRVTSSRLDNVRYPAVDRRLGQVGARVEPLGDVEAEAFMRELHGECRERGLAYSTCVHPFDAELVRAEGCIDGRVVNGWIPGGGRKVWDVAHNAVGAQRRDCACTYSVDIGGSPGVPLCSSAGFGCVYCYAQGRGLGPARREVERLLETRESREWSRR